MDEAPESARAPREHLGCGIKELKGLNERAETYKKQDLKDVPEVLKHNEFGAMEGVRYMTAS